MFGLPKGLAIDPTTNFLYICDLGKDNVQVFNKSFEFVFQFSDRMQSPASICINQNKVYVTQIESNQLTVYSTDGKFLQSVGEEGKDHLEFDVPRGLDVSSELNKIYIAEHRNCRIQSLNLDLSFHSIIDDVLGANDVKLTPEEIIVLSCASTAVSIYSYSHQLIRQMIPHGKTSQLKSPGTFILDKSSNFFITDIESHCVCVYSYGGEFLRKFGKEGNQEGEFIKPYGIAISPEGKIILTSDNPNHHIQIF